MAESRVIAAYLAQLERELRVPARLRRRVLAEVADHVGEAVAARRQAGSAAGAAEREAVERFGPPRQIAGQFLEELAARSAHRACDVLTLAMLGWCVVALPFLRLGGSVSAHLVPGLVIGLAVQVGAVAGGLSLVRSLRHRVEQTIPPRVLRVLVRSMATTVAAMLVGLTAETALAIHRPAELLASPVLLVFGAVLLAMWPVAFVATVAVAKGAARAAAVGAGPGQSPARAPGESVSLSSGDVVDDLVAFLQIVLALVAHRIPWARPAVAWIARAGSGLAAAIPARLPHLFRWLDLRRHPWRFCTLVTGAAVFGMVVVEVVGADRLDGGVALASALAGGALEGIAVVLGFALLGRLLDIRRRPGDSTSDLGGRRGSFSGPSRSRLDSEGRFS